MEFDQVDVAVIGSGPAGYTAALYAARAGRAPVVIEGAEFGGALMTTTEIENFPGFPDGVQGPELMMSVREQAERFGAVMLPETAIGVDLVPDLKSITTTERTLSARSVVLAMGSAHRRLGLPAEDRLAGTGVFWCATCDGPPFKGRDVVVVGGGDCAMEEALFLARFARSVRVVHRRAELRASRAMADRALADPAITFVWQHDVVDLAGDTELASVRVRSSATGTVTELAADGLFVAIGHEPRTDLVRDQVALDEAGYVWVDGRTSHTSVTGVFAAGDVVDHRYRQAITAAGSGCEAALDAERFLTARPLDVR